MTLGEDYIVLKHIDKRLLLESYKKLFDIDVTRMFNEIETINLCKCLKTGYIYFSPFTIIGDEQFYKDLQHYEWYYQSEKWEFEISRKHIVKGHLLEIGCGNGDFLDSLKNKHLLTFQGTELNSDAVNICKSKNLNVGHKSLSDFQSDSFDYIVSFQVLEHISAINDFFVNSYRVIKRGGKLIISVPNTKSYVFYPFTDYYLQNGSLLLNMPPHHVGWWNNSSIQKVAKLFGFHLKKIYFEPLPFYRKELVQINLQNQLKNIVFSKLFNILPYYLMKKMFNGETILVVLEK
ncbi:MAG TPA: methyltransferase domain-containing protein [Bacteroidales bacterium]|nr:methyltransferase domain-containing protein [Bacteroidales bacterium]